MKQRGRKSTASLTVLTFDRPAIAPPSSLSAAEATYFREIVATKPSDYFTDENVAILISICRARVAGDKVADILNSKSADEIIRDEGTAGLARLLSMREKQDRLVASLSTKLRLTPQSRWAAKDAARIPPAPPPKMAKPWADASK